MNNFAVSLTGSQRLLVMSGLECLIGKTTREERLMSIMEVVELFQDSTNEPPSPVNNMTHKALDENGQDAYYEDWLWGCKPDNQSGIGSNGERVTVALALRIAADVLRSFDGHPKPSWTGKDLKLARAAIAGLRAQQGIEEYPGGREIMLTHFCDIAIYG